LVFYSDHDLEYGEGFNCGNMWARILETCEVNPKNVAIIVIIRTVNSRVGVEVEKNLGISLFTISDGEEIGIEQVISKAIEIAEEGTERIYASLDVDTIDPLFFPAQKWPWPFGLTSFQVRDALRQISRD
jgi:arginase family enzyme